MGKKEEKTNVMRILDQKKIPYGSHNYLENGPDPLPELQPPPVR